MIPSVADRLTGAFPVVPTPFHEDQTLDLDGLGEVVDRLLAAGIRGLTVLGSGSESVYLTDEERLAVVEHTARRVAGRATIVAGLIQFGTQVATDQGKRFRDLGADALLLGLPQPYDMPLVQVIAHFTAVVRDVKLPTLYYHAPKPGHLRLAPEQVGTLFGEVSLVGIENASKGSSSDVRAQIRAVGRPIAMFTAHSADCLDCLTEGGVGAMCPVTVLMPKTILKLVGEHRIGNDEAAKAAQERLLLATPIIALDPGETSPAAEHWGIKEALVAAGILQSGTVRQPQTGLSPERRARIRSIATDLVEL